MAGQYGGLRASSVVQVACDGGTSLLVGGGLTESGCIFELFLA